MVSTVQASPTPGRAQAGSQGISYYNGFLLPRSAPTRSAGPGWAFLGALPGTRGPDPAWTGRLVTHRSLWSFGKAKDRLVL